MLKGIGNIGIFSTVHVLSNDDLGDDHMQNDIVIGREILNQGFNIVISSGRFKISRTKIINMCTNSDSADIHTELDEQDKVKLHSLLAGYSNSLIKGIPCTKVKVGEMKIRLIDPRAKRARFSSRKKKLTNC